MCSSASFQFSVEHSIVSFRVRASGAIRVDRHHLVKCISAGERRFLSSVFRCASLGCPPVSFVGCVSSAARVASAGVLGIPGVLAMGRKDAQELATGQRVALVRGESTPGAPGIAILEGFG